MQACKERPRWQKAVVALAHKSARILRAEMMRSQRFDPQHINIKLGTIAPLEHVGFPAGQNTRDDLTGQTGSAQTLLNISAHAASEPPRVPRRFTRPKVHANGLEPR